MSDMNDPVVKAIVEARVNLLFNHPFFGNLATRLKLVDATKWCPTAATDGRHFFYNRDFIKKLTRQELLFLVGHEVLHAVYDHIGRGAGKDHEIHNMATDYIVNYTLKKEQVGEMIKGGLLSEKYTDEMSSEEVYNLLKKNSVKIQMPIDMHLDGGQGDDKKKSQSGQGDGDGQMTVTVVGEDGPPSLTEEELNQIRNEVRAATISAAQACAGRVPAGIARLIEQLVEPKMDWREMLEMHIKSAVKDDFTFRRLSKRTWSTGCILPGQNDSDTIDIVCTIDTSGSMTNEMLTDFLSEVHGIMTMFPDFRLRLFTFDTKVYDFKEFTPSNIDEIHEYPMSGGGGTDFECAFNFLKAQEIEPNKLVFFTDGYPCGSWGDENLCDTLFIIHGDHKIVPPFGSVAYYTDHKK